MPPDLNSHLSSTGTDSPVAGVEPLEGPRKSLGDRRGLRGPRRRAALLYSKSLPRVYQSSSLIEMNPRAPQPLGDGSGQTSFDMSALFMDPQEYYQTQYNIITSRSVLKAAAEATSLGSDYGFFGLSQAPERPIARTKYCGASCDEEDTTSVKGKPSRLHQVSTSMRSARSAFAMR